MIDNGAPGLEIAKYDSDHKTRCACSNDTLFRSRQYVWVVGGGPYGVGVQKGNGYRREPTPVTVPEQSVARKPRARKRPKGAPTHVRSWPLRPNPAQCRDIRTRFFTGMRVYNAVLGEFIRRSCAVKSDPGWQAARQLRRRTQDERAARRAAFDAVVQVHGFTAG